MTDADARALVAKKVRAEMKVIASTVPDLDAERLTTALVSLSNRIIDHYITFLFTEDRPRPTGVPN